MVKFLKKLLPALKKWENGLRMNGEAIYDTRPWVVYGEGPQEIKEGHLSEHKNKEAVAEDIRFTTNGNNLYAIALDWPKDGKLNVKSLSTSKSYLKSEIKNLQLLGHKGELKWGRSGERIRNTTSIRKSLVNMHL